MTDLVEFLTSEEIIIVYVIAGVLCLISFFVYLGKSRSSKYRMKSNTKELNKLVEEVSDIAPVVDEVVSNEPVIESAEVVSNSQSVGELLDSTKELRVDSPVDSEIQVPSNVVNNETSIMEVEDTIDTPIITSSTEELEYTSIEPTMVEAKEELEKLKSELKRQEEIEPEMENIALNNYEEEQEASAIISLDELVKKGGEIYATNEATQYIEDDAPISIQDLENRVGQKTVQYDKPFAIEDVVPTAIAEEPTIVNTETIDNTTDYNTKFKSSPIISPIYGIEKNSASSDGTDIALENTASYEKLDAEIKKTNEFLVTLKDLQNRLD